MTDGRQEDATAQGVPIVGEPTTAVAWLRLEVTGRSWGLARDECLLLATAIVEAAARGKGGEVAGGTGATGDGIEGVAARVPAVAAWLESAAVGGDSRVARLAESIRVEAEDRADHRGAERIAPEAALLLASARLAVVHEHDRRRFDRAVAEARLEGLRELAYGAGHEINNPLANIASRAQALLLDEADPERRRRLATIVEQSFRARDMIGGLMLFARPPRPRPEEVDISGVVAAAIESVRPAATARGARLEYSPLPVSLAVLVDRVQIEEVIRVVTINAIEAVSAGGRVVLSVMRVAGGGCEITVSDDGRGMTAETLRRAFDPFYSGREAGRGIGLGLPKAWRLVEVNGGGIVIDSRPGQGTRVAIRLPQAVDPAVPMTLASREAVNTP